MQVALNSKKIARRPTGRCASESVTADQITRCLTVVFVSGEPPVAREFVDSLILNVVNDHFVEKPARRRSAVVVTDTQTL
jgi:hypothetical protein